MTRTTTYDFGTSAAVGLILLGLGAGLTAQAPATAESECARVDQGGYFTFADPTCAAAFWTGDGDDPAGVWPEPAAETETEAAQPGNSDTPGTAPAL